MSDWGKILAPITVPSGGWDFVVVAGSGETPITFTATVPAATYATVLELVAALKTQLDSETSQTWTCTISSVGILTLSVTWAGPDSLDVTFASCADALLLVLGFDETELFAQNGTTWTISANNAHTYGWYPGIISYGTALGEGLVDDSGWFPVDSVSRQVAGTGTARIIAPARLQYLRRLVFGLVKRSELFHRSRGPICLADKWVTSQLRWYPDRDDGTVATPGTAGDPGHSSYDADADCDYYKVTLTGAVRYTANSQHPDWFRVELDLNAEP